MIAALSSALHRALVILAVAYFVALISMVLVAGTSVFFLCKALPVHYLSTPPRDLLS
jgi:hypothetical protein